MGCLTWIRGFKVTFHFKEKVWNRMAGIFNSLTFLMTSFALVSPNWFKIKGLYCSRRISLMQLFCIAENEDNHSRLHLDQFGNMNMPELYGLPDCITSEIVLLMRVIILLCFMIVIWSCIGAVINFATINHKTMLMIRRNAVPSIICVLLVILVVGVCYYITVVLGNANNSDTNTMEVEYEFGFYTLTGAGALALFASAANLWGAPLFSNEDVQRRNLLDDWDGYETHGVGPTPHVPTLPPYTPNEDFIPTSHPPYIPPVLGTQQYFPLDLSALPAPPPYTP